MTTALAPRMPTTLRRLHRAQQSLALLGDRVPTRAWVRVLAVSSAVAICYAAYLVWIDGVRWLEHPNGLTLADGTVALLVLMGTLVASWRPSLRRGPGGVLWVAAGPLLTYLLQAVALNEPHVQWLLGGGA